MVIVFSNLLFVLSSSGKRSTLSTSASTVCLPAAAVQPGPPFAVQTTVAPSSEGRVDVVRPTHNLAIDGEGNADDDALGRRGRADVLDNRAEDHLVAAFRVRRAAGDIAHNHVADFGRCPGHAALAAARAWGARAWHPPHRGNRARRSCRGLLETMNDDWASTSS